MTFEINISHVSYIKLFNYYSIITINFFIISKFVSLDDCENENRKSVGVSKLRIYLWQTSKIVLPFHQTSSISVSNLFFYFMFKINAPPLGKKKLKIADYCIFVEAYIVLYVFFTFRPFFVSRLHFYS